VLGKLDRVDRQLATVRLVMAGVALALAFGAWVASRWSGLWVLVPVAGFVPVALLHTRRLDERRAQQRRLAEVEDGIARLENRWHGRGDVATTYVPTHHPNAEDLDLFGHGSLFDLLNRCRTDAGTRCLAAWLLEPASPEVVAARQAAVRELAGCEPFREALATLGPDVPDAAATVGVVAWASAPTAPPALWARVTLVAMSTATLTGLGLWSYSGEPPAWIGGALAAQGVVGLWLRPRVLNAIRQVDDKTRELALAATLIERVEREPFTAPLLAEIQRRLAAGGTTASRAIQRLARLADLLASRQNQFFGPASILLFWATQLAWAIDEWRSRFGRYVPDWFEAIGELEALASLATFAAERPEAIFPTVQAGPAHIDADALAHPLLPPDSAVANDVMLGGAAPHLVLVRGSNMSGKSTHLRAIGVNAALAQAGAPVTARRLSMSPLVVAGTLRVQDSLQAGQSRFFAEITKLRQIVDLARAPRDTGTLFLIDELLAGTNSHDRQRGADRVLRGLVDLGAIGFATTHDLALTTLAADPAVRAVNVHFADSFDDGNLTFDYRLRPGVVETSNALALMRAIGLDV
jgi:MutS domain V/MutS domain III